MSRRLSYKQVNEIMFDLMSMSSADLCREIFARGYAQAEKDAKEKRFTEAEIDRAFFAGRMSVFKTNRNPAAYLLNYKKEHFNDDDN